MIIFEAIRWKNFLSTGNNWTEINLIKSKSTLVIGQNGAGKSTFVKILSGDYTPTERKYFLMKKK